jgi:hypothetical protein
MKLKTLLAGVAAISVLAGCEMPQQGELSRTQTGALTGAAIGGILGATSGSSDRWARPRSAPRRAPWAAA